MMQPGKTPPSISSRRYEKVPIRPESDSEDDQMTLYAGSSFNNHANNRIGNDFGVEIYDSGKDLEMGQYNVSQRRRKKARKIRRGSCLVRFLVTCSAILTLLILALLILISSVVLGKKILPGGSSIATPNPTCPPGTASGKMPPFCHGSSVTRPKFHTTEVPVVSTSESHVTASTTNPSTEEQSTSTDMSTVEKTNPTAPLVPTSPPPSSQPAGTTKSTSNKDDHTIPSNPVTNEEQESTKSTYLPTDGSISLTNDSTSPTDESFSPTDESTSTTNSSSSVNLLWEKLLSPGSSESPPELCDLNEDGMKDLVIVQDVSECTSKVIVLDAINGTTLWEKTIHFPATAVRCLLDVNNDSVQDCIVTGRMGGFIALDGRNGSLLWTVDGSIVFPLYNFYCPLDLADMNNDGVEDIVNIHGGDSSLQSLKKFPSSPGFFVVVSGRTGEKLMEPIPMPDGHESHTSPVLYTVNQTNQFILFGSGGNTIPGSLWAIEVKSLRNHVQLFTAEANAEYEINRNETCLSETAAVEKMSNIFNETKFQITDRNTSKSNCSTWSNKTALENQYVCLYEIAHSDTKGVILPPVIVDLTSDGIEDLVVSLFDGGILVLDGHDISTVVWETHYPGTESHSIPAPLFYTLDQIPDLVIWTNDGEYPLYNTSTVRVLNGANGSLLWESNFTHSGVSISSAVSVVAKTHGQDAFIFIVVGTNKGSKLNPQRTLWKDEGPVNGTKEDSQIFNSSMDHTDPPDLWISTDDDPVPDPRDLDAMLEYCDMNKSELTASVYMVTREMVESGMEVLPLASYEPYIALAPDFNSTNFTRHNHTTERPSNLTRSSDLQALRCNHISFPVSTSTTPLLLGDFDGDGQLDISYEIVWSCSNTVLPKMLLVASSLEVLFVKTYGNETLNFDEFLSPSEQPWTRYMGRKGDNSFEFTLSNS